MILIRANKGTSFVNDKEIIELSHDKKKKEVFISFKNDKCTSFKNVEQVLYSSDVQPTEWDSRSSEFEELKEKYKMQEECLQKAEATYKKLKDDAFDLVCTITSMVKNELTEENRKYLFERAETIRTRILYDEYEYKDITI